MKKRLFLVLCIVFIMNSMLSTYAAATNVKRGNALNAVISATKNDKFKEVTKKNAYKSFKDNKTFNKKLKDTINVALANKIVKKSKKFYAKKAITRIELARWICAAMKKTGYVFRVKKCIPPKYKDVKKKADKKVLNYLYVRDVMTGVSRKKFAPNKKVTKKLFKKVMKNLKRAIDNRYIEDVPEENPSAAPTVTPTVAPTTETMADATAGVTIAPTVAPPVEGSANPTTEPAGKGDLSQYVKNPFMETDEGYSVSGKPNVNQVKGYVGNGIKVEPIHAVFANIVNSDSLAGKEVEFSFDVKKLSTEAERLQVTLGSTNGKLMQGAMVVEATDLEKVDEWKHVTGQVKASNMENFDEFRVSFAASGDSFVIDNFNIVYAEEGNYVSRASYVSDDFEVRAVVDHANGTISAFVPAEGTYELKAEVVGDKDEALANYEEKCTVVDTENQQLTLTSGYEASDDTAGKVDYKVTVDGKEYVLLSNNGDESGMRNYLAYSKAQKFVADDEDDWPGQSDLLTSESYGFVDLFADGQYLGVYTMVEDITKKSIDNLEFMVEFNADGNYSVGDLKYDIVNKGSMSAADVQAYIEDVNNAFAAFKTVGATSSQLTAFENTFAGLVDVYSCVDWMLFNEYFVTSDIDKKFYAYKEEGELLRFAVWDDYSISGGNDDSISVGEDSLYVMNNNTWADGLGYRRNISPLIGNRWFFCRWYVVNKFADELEALKTQVVDAYKYDVQLWGTELDGMDDYVDWMLARTNTIATICGGFGNDIW